MQKNLAKSVVLYAKVARVQALFLSLGPIVCTYFYCKYRCCGLNFSAFSLVAASFILFHLAVNTISEYRDFQKGVDDPACAFPKYRIVAGIVEPIYVFRIGIAALVLAAIAGVAAVFCSTPMLLIPGFMGAALAWFYSENPVGYKYKCAGEIGVFLAYGPLLGFSVVYSLAGKFDIVDLLFSVPFGLLSVTVLLANNIRDYNFDLGRTKTLSTVLGLKMSYVILFFVTHLSFLFVPILVYIQALPAASLLTLCASPLILLSVKRIGNPRFIDVFGMLNAAYSIILTIILSIY